MSDHEKDEPVDVGKQEADLEVKEGAVNQKYIKIGELEAEAASKEMEISE